MKFRTTLVAALVLLLVGIYVYVFEYKRAKETEEQEEQAKKVFPGDWEKLKGLRLTDSHGTFLLEKGAGPSEKEAGEGSAETGWRILEPVHADADELAVDAMVRGLKGLDVERVVVEGPEDLAPFGLKEPKMKIEALFEEGEAACLTLLVGDKSPVGENSYGMRQGREEVLLLRSDMKARFDKNLYDLREKRLFRFDTGSIEKIEILRDGRPWAEMNREGDNWNLVSPISARVEKSKAGRILNELTNLRAQTFDREGPGDLQEFGLAGPRREVFFTLAPDHARVSVKLGKDRSDQGRNLVYAKRGESQEVVSVDAQILETIEFDPESLRAREADTQEGQGGVEEEGD